VNGRLRGRGARCDEDDGCCKDECGEVPACA